ncbi:hypothetical protein CCR75_006159 [Bremia lactucae]|uniref:Uncharacterized protein n=1 Tax=Bremia lactucae TaxID=4779 RepID=A0A976IJG8_BRELC|nr:hypothetical protein CCR75_006159 [Bremia lactucae]
MTAERLEGTEAAKILRLAKANISSGGARKIPMIATETLIKMKSAADWMQKGAMQLNLIDVSKALTVLPTF